MLRLLAILWISAMPLLLNAETTKPENDEIPPGGIRHCARCVEARENNLKHPNEYFYYEDYLEAKDKPKKAAE